MNSLTLTSKILTKTSPNLSQTRCFWGWINMMFNKVDESRLKKNGPDRTCAEWLLRNGGAVKFISSKNIVADYNGLPSESAKVAIEEVDASNSSIMHNGFDHFRGCKHIKSVILHNCSYLNDEALGLMHPINDSLKYLQISECNNITDEGLMNVTNLTKLDTLVIGESAYIKDLDKVVGALKAKLPNTNVQYKTSNKAVT